ncbi:hypothetical protein [Yimella sp. cx-51]|uniref:hypothetical protein n=1 Tax=Yimella sp. cx-51 TaxID=2770551 RepID=UPI00165D3EF0|nr:hypothetical protein [Yimella sp. cx-51]MBC9956979.1 hypothetical protein [Yimella sp. cx-51]QTH39194.1 hypothetical protein J5M86_06180 [Yimella sp. cx-51]
MTDTLPGLLLLHADAKLADAWVRRGVVPSYVVPLPGWTAIVPADDTQVRPPYDDALTVTANRPVPTRLRTALGFFVIDGVAIVSGQTRGWRSAPRMLSWTAGHGADEVPGFPPLKLGQLAECAGVHPDGVGEVRSILARREGRPVEVLHDVIGALALPGAAMLHGSGVKSDLEAVLVEPGKRAVDHFTKIASDEADMRAELRDNL